MADAPASPPPSDEPETDQQRAARYGYQILPSGSWVSAKDKGPWAKPFKARFGLDWRPDDDPDEAHRQRILRDVKDYMTSRFGPKDKPANG